MPTGSCFVDAARAALSNPKQDISDIEHGLSQAELDEIYGI
jgi:hypothetical protein